MGAVVKRHLPILKTVGRQKFEVIPVEVGGGGIIVMIGFCRIALSEWMDCGQLLSNRWFFFHFWDGSGRSRNGDELLLLLLLLLKFYRGLVAVGGDFGILWLIRNDFSWLEVGRCGSWSSRRRGRRRRCGLMERRLLLENLLFQGGCRLGNAVHIEKRVAELDRGKKNVRAGALISKRELVFGLLALLQGVLSSALLAWFLCGLGWGGASGSIR